MQGNARITRFAQAFAFAAFILLANTSGCEQQKKSFKGECRIEKVNGRVTEVTVKVYSIGVGDSTSNSYHSREELEGIIEGVEEFLFDLKAARDEMEIVEPPLEKENES